jgi:TRAP-type uncharacterized transport system substrate-binding protein
MGTSVAGGTYYRVAITIAKITEIEAVWKMQVADNKY